MVGCLLDVSFDFQVPPLRGGFIVTLHIVQTHDITLYAIPSHFNRWWESSVDWGFDVHGVCMTKYLQPVVNVCNIACGTRGAVSIHRGFIFDQRDIEVSRSRMKALCDPHKDVSIGHSFDKMPGHVWICGDQSCETVSDIFDLIIKP